MAMVYVVPGQTEGDVHLYLWLPTKSIYITRVRCELPSRCCELFVRSVLQDHVNLRAHPDTIA
jgi:hypothetical protein